MANDIIETKYLNIISGSLKLFKQKDSKTWNFRCPLCGDSKKDKLKTRAYFYRKGQGVRFFCHNCREGYWFKDFLKKYNRSVYDEFMLEIFTPRKKQVVSNADDFKVVLPKPKLKIRLPKLSDLPKDHMAVEYFTIRKIPNKFLDMLYYAEDFKAFVDDFWPENGKKLIEDEQRLIIPFNEKNGDVVGVQGRSFSKTGIRYITIKPDAESIKAFGSDKVDYDLPVRILEGPIDSMFVNNAVAMMDCSLYKASEILDIPEKNVIDIYDNDYRNTEVVSQIRRSVARDHKIVIWPDEVSEYKDVNDMVMAGFDIEKLIRNNTYSGLQAKLELGKWMKI